MSMEDANAVIRRWRTNVKLKMRGITSFEERAQLRFDAIKSHLYRQRITANNWRMRRARYLSPGQYEFLDKAWQPFKVGQPWGDEDMTAFFRSSSSAW
jgi:hypothetical protein